MPSEELHSAIERLALERVPGQGPVAVERLGAGLVNESYRVTRAGRTYSLRVPSAHAALLGLDHDWECRVLARASAEGLAPAVESCDPATGVLVMRWVPGGVWTAAEVRQPANIERIARLMRRIHRLPLAPGACIKDPAAWIRHYHRALESSALERPAHGSLSGELAQHLARYAGLPAAAPALCHSDLHVDNLKVGEHGLVLLDWEYAHVADPFWDLAGWIVNNDWNEECSRLLLERYTGGAPSAANMARLRLLAWLYGYLCVAWIELYLALRPEPAPDGIGGLAARARALTQRLARPGP